MLSAQQYAEQAQALYSAHANPDNAAPMQQYMKQIAPFLGIKTPLRRQLSKQFWQTYGIPPIEQVPEVVRALYSMPYRELHYLAIELVEFYAKKWQPKDLDLLEYIITTHSWWDSVDAVRKTVGVLLLRHPQLQEPATRQWLASGNQWLQRMSLIFQLGYKKNTNLDLLYYNILSLANSKAFFIQKAIGWILREYARTDAAEVRRFVAATQLPALSRREAMKHLS